MYQSSIQKLSLRYGFVLILSCLSWAAAASYLGHPEAESFADEMQSQHGFSAQEMRYFLSQVHPVESVLRYIQPNASPHSRSWQSYRRRVIDPVRTKAATAFWQKNQHTLQAAERRYGVPAAIIVSILGVETIYGRNMGRFEVASALATLAFDYPPRAGLFRDQLKQLLLLARDARRDVFSYRGSFAGAIGQAQFLPGSIRRYAVDFDQDGRIDLERSPADAIGSVANFLREHGWEKQQPITLPLRVAEPELVQPLVVKGWDPQWSLQDLRQAHVRPVGHAADLPVAVIDLPTPDEETEYWLGYRNFWVITRYNRSSFYAMSVFQFATHVCQQPSLRQACSSFHSLVR